MANSDYMMSNNNQFGVRPDELIGAISGGYVSVAPTVAQVQTAISTYNDSSNTPYSAQEVGMFNRLANYLNNGVQQVAQPAQPTQKVMQVTASPVTPFTQPMQQFQSLVPNQFVNPVEQVAGIPSKNLEQYIVLGVLFLTVSSIIGLFRR